jgi:hypothetical protein
MSRSRRVTQLEPPASTTRVELSASGLAMIDEVMVLIENRTAELEKS